MYATERTDDLNGWIAEIGTVLARVASPDTIANGHRTDTVLLAFTIEPHGELADIRVAGSSGDPGLDRLAIAKLRRAAPLPAGPPCAMRRTQVVAMRLAEQSAPPYHVADRSPAFA
jgi:TonB family protein